MTRWEYRVLTSFEDASNLIRELDLLGEVGWELVSVTMNKNWVGITYTSYLKRIKE